MTPDPIPGVLAKLTAHQDQITELTDLVTAVRRLLDDHQAALTRLENPDGQDAAGKDGRYQPGPAATWWKLTGAERQEPITQLHAWIEQVYRPGYGHLAAALGQCWQSHDLCLYGLDILSGLWSALYLQPRRTPGLLTAQAEYQSRILPALADQLRLETSRCGHPRHPAPVIRRPRTAP
jgi:hypothetical protein